MSAGKVSGDFGDCGHRCVGGGAPFASESVIPLRERAQAMRTSHTSTCPGVMGVVAKT